MTVTENSLIVRKRDGWYSIEGRDGGRLRTRGGMRHGVLRTADARWPITVTNFWRTGVAVGSGDMPLIRLDRERAYTPGGPVEWSLGRGRRGCRATVARGADRITVANASRFSSALRVEVVGTWSDLDLVVLSASFAVLSWRRGHRLRTMAVVGAISHH